jgi:hypothetical protein
MNNLKDFLERPGVKLTKPGEIVGRFHTWYTCVQRLDAKDGTWDCIVGTYSPENDGPDKLFRSKFVSTCTYIPDALEKKVFEMKNKNHVLHKYTEFIH